MGGELKKEKTGAEKTKTTELTRKDSSSCVKMLSDLYFNYPPTPPSTPPLHKQTENVYLGGR